VQAKAGTNRPNPFVTNYIFGDIYPFNQSIHQSLKEVFYLASFPPCHFFFYNLLLALCIIFLNLSSLLSYLSLLLTLLLSLLIRINHNNLVTFALPLSLYLLFLKQLQQVLPKSCIRHFCLNLGPTDCTQLLSTTPPCPLWTWVT